MSATDPDTATLREQLCVAAIEYFGKFGFDRSLLDMSEATDTDTETIVRLFGSVDGLRNACDDYIQSTIQAAKTEALTSPDPNSVLSQMASIESFAPMMTYLMRTLKSRDEHGQVLLEKMTITVEKYLDDAVRAGTVKPSRDSRARARFLAYFNGGGFLMYAQQHHDPDDMESVLRDYAREMLMPAMEIFTYGLMADDSVYRGILAGAEGPR